MKLRELYTTVLVESVADVVKSLRTNYPEPNQIDLINSNLNWIRQTFPKGAEWYMLLVGAQMSGDQDKLKKRLGNYAFTTFDKLQEKLAHFSTLEYQPIKDYAFNNKPVSEVFTELTALEQKWTKLPSRPVHAQQGDYIIKDYNNGIQWWFVDRAFCSEEGRSGKHCGNVVGKNKKTQRILSLRHNMKVLLTFILLPNGYIGEMKANGNQKPDPQYHQYIMDILLSNMVTGIKGAGWGPEFNFSIFDLDDKNLQIIMQQRPSFISDQILATPREILKAPDIIRNNPEYQNIAINQDMDLENFFVNGKLDNSVAAWERAIESNPKYIIYAPVELDNYKERVIAMLIESPYLFLESPRHVIKDSEITTRVVQVNPEAIRHIPPAGITPGLYESVLAQNGNYLGEVPEEMRTLKLCKLAISNSGSAIVHVPDHLKSNELYTLAVNNGCPLYFLPTSFKTPEVYKAVVSRDGFALKNVPEEERTEEICKAAVSTYKYALSYVPEQFKTPELYALAVKHGAELDDVPTELRTPKMIKLAIAKDGKNISHVPREERTPELYALAVKSNGYILSSVPREFKTPEMCKDAVQHGAAAINDVPHEMRTSEVCEIAIKQNGALLRFVPDELRTPNLCKIAVATEGTALREVPYEYQTSELCEIAVLNSPWALGDVPMEHKTPELCYKAVSSYGHVLQFVPEELRTIKMCSRAVRSYAGALLAVPNEIGETDPNAYYKICKLTLTVGFNNPDDEEQPEFGAMELLQLTRYTVLLSEEQQADLEQIANDIDGNDAF